MDEQCANKHIQPRDLVEGNDAKMLTGFVTNKNLDAPILYPGTQVGDEKIDNALNKFVDREKFMINYANDDTYDDEVFKRRNLDHIKKKELLKRTEVNSQGTFLLFRDDNI